MQRCTSSQFVQYLTDLGKHRIEWLELVGNFLTKLFLMEVYFLYLQQIYWLEQVDSSIVLKTQTQTDLFLGSLSTLTLYVPPTQINDNGCGQLCAWLLALLCTSVNLCWASYNIILYHSFQPQKTPIFLKPSFFYTKLQTRLYVKCQHCKIWSLDVCLYI